MHCFYRCKCHLCFSCCINHIFLFRPMHLSTVCHSSTCIGLMIRQAYKLKLSGVQWWCSMGCSHYRIESERGSFLFLSFRVVARSPAKQEKQPEQTLCLLPGCKMFHYMLVYLIHNTSRRIPSNERLKL